MGSTSTHLTSTRINCTGLSGVTLKFKRWLGVEGSKFDHAYIRISNDGINWRTIWENTGEVTDSSWISQEFDISRIANNKSTVYLRFTMGSTDLGWQYCGWNIDDVEIWGIQAPNQCSCFDNDLIETDWAECQESAPPGVICSKQFSQPVNSIDCNVTYPAMRYSVRIVMISCSNPSDTSSVYASYEYGYTSVTKSCQYTYKGEVVTSDSCFKYDCGGPPPSIWPCGNIIRAIRDGLY